MPPSPTIMQFFSGWLSIFPVLLPRQHENKMLVCFLGLWVAHFFPPTPYVLRITLLILVPLIVMYVLVNFQIDIFLPPHSECWVHNSIREGTVESGCPKRGPCFLKST